MLDDLLIQGNYVHEDPGMVTGNAWGIAVDTGYDSAEAETGNQQGKGKVTLWDSLS